MKLAWVLSLVIGLSLLQAMPAVADTESDLQQWSLILVNHELENNWSARMQVENRLRDDASEVDKQIFKPGGYCAFTDRLKLGMGYKYVKKKDAKDEQPLSLANFGFPSMLLKERIVIRAEMFWPVLPGGGLVEHTKNRGAVNVHPVQNQNVEMGIRIQRTTDS